LTAAEAVADALTNALELDRPELGGMFPDTTASSPLNPVLSLTFSITPLIPQKM